MALRLNGQTTGYTELNAPDNGDSVILTMPGTDGNAGQYLQTDGSGGLSWQTVTDTTTNLTRMTAVATTSGANIDFTIPSGVRKITLLIDEVSQTTNNLIKVQIGTGGSPLTSGYVGRCTYLSSSTGSQSNYSSAFDIRHYDNRFNITGSMELCNITGNTWISTHNAASVSWATNCYGAGVATLSGELDLVRLVAESGTFDNGQAAIMYEV